MAQIVVYAYRCVAVDQDVKQSLTDTEFQPRIVIYLHVVELSCAIDETRPS